MKISHSEGFKPSDLFSLEYNSFFKGNETIKSISTPVLSSILMMDSSDDTKGIFSVCGDTPGLRRYMKDQLQQSCQLNGDIIRQFRQRLNLIFNEDSVPEGNVCFAGNASLRPEFRQSFSLSDILDYCYAVLNSSSCTENFLTDLKDDRDIIRYPFNDDAFFKLAELGRLLRKTHLYQSHAPQKNTCKLIGEGTNRIEKIEHEDERVYINSSQFFSKVLPEVWSLRAGNCLPAQKWLHARRETILKPTHLRAYRKLIHALNQAAQTVSRIDEVYLKP